MRLQPFVCMGEIAAPAIDAWIEGQACLPQYGDDPVDLRLRQGRRALCHCGSCPPHELLQVRRLWTV